MSSTEVDTLYDLEAIKDFLDEDGITVNEAKLGEHGKESENEVNDALRYFGYTFPLYTALQLGQIIQTDYDIAKGICNQLTRGRFWSEGSGDDSIIEQARALLEKFRVRLASQPPSLTM